MNDIAVRNSSQQRQRNKDLDLVDRISAIPDFILGDILSILPTKEAVATSILSKRWKFVWLTVHSLDFHYYDREDYYYDGEEDWYGGCYEDEGWYAEDDWCEGENTEFVQFVNRVLLLLQDTGFLNRFSLYWAPYCISSEATSWINTAITRKVCELSLHLENREGQFEVPMSVFSCASLRSLELNGDNIYVSSVIGVCLPKLESLELISVQFESEKALEELICGCPVLSYLRLIMDDENDFTYIISSTSLSRLEVYFVHECNLKLEASSLEYFKLKGRMPKIFELKGLSSLTEVDFGIYFREQELSQADICNSIVEVFRAFHCMKTLTLSEETMQALSCSTINMSTKFERLVKLETINRYSVLSSLRDLLQGLDNLEVLMIDQKTHLLVKSDLHDHLKWTTPAEVPRCLSNSLKKVVFKARYISVEDELEMIRYMLEHGGALEVMQINFYGEIDGSMFKLVKEICEYPRKSLFCEVKFFGRASNGNVEACFTAPPLTRLKLVCLH